MKLKTNKRKTVAAIQQSLPLAYVQLGQETCQVILEALAKRRLRLHLGRGLSKISGI